jgi:hypothetical protein
MSDKPPAILPGPPGWVMVSLKDLQQLLAGAKPDSLPQVCHVRYTVNAREVFNMRVQLVRHQVASVDLYGCHYGANPVVYPRLELTLDG